MERGSQLKRCGHVQVSQYCGRLRANWQQREGLRRPSFQWTLHTVVLSNQWFGVNQGPVQPDGEYSDTGNLSCPFFLWGTEHIGCHVDSKVIAFSVGEENASYCGTRDAKTARKRIWNMFHLPVLTSQLCLADGGEVEIYRICPAMLLGSVRGRRKQVPLEKGRMRRMMSRRSILERWQAV